jgi:hypothetical protein
VLPLFAMLSATSEALCREYRAFCACPSVDRRKDLRRVLAQAVLFGNNTPAAPDTAWHRLFMKHSPMYKTHYENLLQLENTDHMLVALETMRHTYTLCQDTLGRLWKNGPVLPETLEKHGVLQSLAEALREFLKTLESAAARLLILKYNELVTFIGPWLKACGFIQNPLAKTPPDTIVQFTPFYQNYHKNKALKDRLRYFGRAPSDKILQRDIIDAVADIKSQTELSKKLFNKELPSGYSTSLWSFDVNRDLQRLVIALCEANKRQST